MALSGVLSKNNLSEQDDVNHDDELGEDVNIPKITTPFHREKTDRDENFDDFCITPPRFSLPIETAENQDRSIEIARRPECGHDAARLPRCSFDSAKDSSRINETHDMTITTMAESLSNVETFPNVGTMSCLLNKMESNLEDVGYLTRSVFMCMNWLRNSK